MATSIKFLTADGCGQYSDFVWPKPSGERPGRWVKVEGPLVLCENGIHVPAPGREVEWIDATAWEIEVDGGHVGDESKLAYRRGRLIRRYNLWDERRQRVFAAHCALDVLHLFELERPGDMRPRDAINVALGASATAAARDAAWAAAGAAAWAYQSARLVKATTDPNWLDDSRVLFGGKR